jgi:hypothetical protein
VSKDLGRRLAEFLMIVGDDNGLDPHWWTSSERVAPTKTPTAQASFVMIPRKVARFSVGA